MNFRPLLFAAVGLILGIAAYEAYNVIAPGTVYSFLALAAAVIPAVALAVYGVICRKKALLIVAVLFLAGFGRALLVPAENFENGTYTVEGIVCDVIDPAEGSFVLKDASIDCVPLNNRMKLIVNSSVIPEIGDDIKAQCRVRNAAVRFGSYDERRVLLASGIASVGSCDEFEVISSGRLPVKRGLYNVKLYLKDRIELMFSDNHDIVSGFLLGERSGVDEDEYDDFISTGTSHLLSLSGFHVGLFTALLFFLLPKRYPRLRLITVGLFLLFYCAITGFKPSLVRASLMCVLLLLSEVTEDKRDTLSALSLAAIVILLIRPYMLYSVGFRLSFNATLGILLINSAGATRGRSIVLGRIASAARVTLGATAATALISAQYFGTFQTYGLLANLVSVPLFSVAAIMSFAALLIGLISPFLGSLAAFIPDKLISGAMLLLRLISRLPYAQISVLPPSTLTGILMIAVMFCISCYVLRPVKRRIGLASLAFLLFTSSIIADIIRA